MGNRLTHGLGWRGHWLDMLGGSAGKVNEAIGLPVPQEDWCVESPLHSLNRISSNDGSGGTATTQAIKVFAIQPQAGSAESKSRTLSVHRSIGLPL
jgi:hypothetical protein